MKSVHVIAAGFMLLLCGVAKSAAPADALPANRTPYASPRSDALARNLNGKVLTEEERDYEARARLAIPPPSSYGQQRPSSTVLPTQKGEYPHWDGATVNMSTQQARDYQARIKAERDALRDRDRQRDEPDVRFKPVQ